MNRKKLVLAVLALLLAFSAIWSYIRWPRQQTVARLKHPQGSQALAADRQPVTSPIQDNGLTLKMHLLKKKTTELSTRYHNIFRPVLFDEAKVKKPAPARPPKKSMPMPPFPISTVPQKELIKFTFLGFVQADGQKTVFLERNKEVILVKAGEVFGGRFTARTITDHSMTITVKDTKEEIVVPLVENRGLASASK